MESESIQRLLGRLKALRVARGLTQERFAELSGISYKYYQAVEAGRKRDIRISTIDRLAKALDLQGWQLLLPWGDTAAEPKAPSTARKKGGKRQKRGGN